MAHWQLVHPVGIDLVSGVEVGHGTQLLWRPGIDDLARETAAFELVDTLRVGTYVYGLRERVVEIKLQSVGHRMAQAELCPMVCAISDTTPSVQR